MTTVNAGKGLGRGFGEEVAFMVHVRKEQEDMSLGNFMSWD